MRPPPKEPSDSSPPETSTTDVKLTDHQRFFLKISPIAREIEKEFGISPLILITQSAHESNWGRSGLTEKANNLFGFTGDSWAAQKKPVIFLKTQEFVAGKWVSIERPFRSYASWNESVRDWVRLMHTDRYAKPPDRSPLDPLIPPLSALAYAKSGQIYEFAHVVQAVGYATDPFYAAKLSSLAEKVTDLMR